MTQADIPPTIITVQGRHQRRVAPERATATLRVGFEGADREAVVRLSTRAATAISDALGGLHDRERGPVVWWAADQLRVWADRPWNQDGARLPLVFHAQLAIRARFSDFGVLAEWLERMATTDGVAVDGVEWDVTETTRTSVTTEVRARAVRDAVDKATVYAHSIGLSKVRAVAIADPGMLGDQAGGGSTDQPMFARAMAMDVGGAGGSLEFTPEDIELVASVDARFVAS